MFEIRAIELGLEHVVGVERERVAHGGSANRSERKPVDVLVLREVLADAERVAAGGKVGIADGHSRDLHGGGHVLFLQGRRDAEHVRDVVEAVRGVVGRQERRDVDFEVEQVAHRVRILGAVQAVEDRRAGIRMRGGLGVERGFERRLHRVVRRLVGMADALRRHGARLQFTHDFLPEPRVRPCPGGIEALERQTARLQTLAVTADAVLVQRASGHGRRGGDRGRRLRRRRRSGGLGGL